MISFKDLCIDATDPEVQARFWAAALGLRAELSGGDFRLVDEVPEHTLWVNKVPEPRTRETARTPRRARRGSL